MAGTQIVINYVPGEECRVAVLMEDRLEEFHAERMDSVSHVGNIYVGRVVNVEAGIQAAFVDFGLEHNGFLHVSDLHPQYFPGEGEDTTERVGKKTPRRDRPPIQECLRRGQEIAVQVLKEGVGSKGPTVTSYLSIPGRFLVMMPQMDRVGVSRKVEDEEARRKMREILDQLELPDGFGFILRTAGMDQTKAELKRDLAYLQRLWKDMERRWHLGNKPRLLYSESDLLVRALRDILTSDVERIVIDNEHAMARAARFLKIVAPRNAAKLVRYTGGAPIFHAMGVEPQIQTIHAREVPLPSGGRLVIDETEALVAIDVNSGRMRGARDAETTAYRTNQEAADEICRQLKLRDLGGVVINDFIDMRLAKHRREIEGRVRDNLKRDRARWTIAPISEFGILEMTRQRMRGSHESIHFSDCPVCRGRGLVQRPDSVAGDALRELGAILDNPKVHRAEMVVHPRIAGELLSGRRRAIGRLERASGKRIDVRISEAIPVDRVTFYAYDEQGADLDVAKAAQRAVRADELVPYEISATTGDEWADQVEPPVEVEPEPVEEVPAVEPHPIELEPGEVVEIHPVLGGGPQRGQQQPDGDGKRRRRRRRGRGRGGEGAEGGGRGGHPEHERGSGGGRGPHDRAHHESDESGSDGPTVGGTNDQGAGSAAPLDGGDAGAPGGQPDERRGRRRRRRGRGRGRGGEGAPAQEGAAGSTSNNEPFEGDAQGDGPSGDRMHASDDAPMGGASGADGAFEGGENAHGVDGSAADPMLNGEGGGGRRRRRRRRRGGRGRGGQSEHSGQPGQMGGHADQGDGPSGHRDHADGSRGSEQNRSEPARSEHESAHPEGGQGGGEGEGSRRRRRRRRGRGRGGQGEGRPDGQGGGSGGGGGGGGGEGGRGQREPAPQRSAPPPQPAVTAKPRSLYGASRRRLAPSEKKNLGSEE